MIAAYYRVSSKAQDIGMQKAAVERAAAARGDGIAAVYEEKRSAKTVDRPVLARLRQAAREGKIAKLYLYRLDRLTRSGIRDTLEVMDELRRHGVEVVSVADGFDPSGPAAEIILAVMAWAAKMERLAINERIAAARERVEAEGGSWGRKPSLDAATTARGASLCPQHGVRRAAAMLGVSKSALSRAVLASRNVAAK
jgi:DNA invertase Pin-like site-specific DNA recombinase